MISVRRVLFDDIKRLLEIYSYYVKETAVTFEYEVPSIEEFQQRIQQTLQTYPYLVAERNDEIIGYAYAGPFHSRKAYQWNVETSVYVKADCRKSGVGRALYEALEQILKEMNIQNLNACIAYPIREDEYLTKDSVRFHEKMGYQMVGEFHYSGYKFNRWYNMVWMEKMLGEHSGIPLPVIPFSKWMLTEEMKKKI